MPHTHTSQANHVHGYAVFDIAGTSTGAAAAPAVRGWLNTNQSGWVQAATVSHVQKLGGGEHVIVYLECAAGRTAADVGGVANQIRGALTAHLAGAPIVFCCISDM